MPIAMSASFVPPIAVRSGHDPAEPRRALLNEFARVAGRGVADPLAPLRLERAEVQDAVVATLGANLHDGPGRADEAPARLLRILHRNGRLHFRDRGEFRPAKTARGPPSKRLVGLAQLSAGHVHHRWAGGPDRFE
jgi:hypothetical protein